MHRTFTTQHWKKLHTLLTSWKTNLHVIREQVSIIERKKRFFFVTDPAKIQAFFPELL
jgi:eIF3 subunit M, C-terminal helix